MICKNRGIKLSLARSGNESERKTTMQKLVTFNPTKHAITMKKFLILFAVLTLSFNLKSQSDIQGYQVVQQEEVKPVRLGFIAAPALTWLSVENQEIDSKGLRAGFSFGALIDFTIAKTENYAFSTGIMMNMADGGNLQNLTVVPERGEPGGLEPAMRDVSLSLQYLQVPLTLKLKTNEIGYMSYYGQLGLQGGIKFGARENGEYEYLRDPNSRVVIERENVNDETQLFNAGMLVGIGTEYNISGSTYLVFGLSYYHGFTNVLSNSVLLLDQDGEVVFDNGIPLTGGKRRGTLRNITLNVAVIF